jgi:hypothetical protein
MQSCSHVVPQGVERDEQDIVGADESAYAQHLRAARRDASNLSRSRSTIILRWSSRAGSQKAFQAEL